MRRRSKNILSFIVSLILTFCFLITILLVFFKSTVTNIGLYNDTLISNKGARNIYENINSKTNYLLLTNNIPQDTLVDIITKEQVQNELNETLGTAIEYFLGFDTNGKSLDTEPYLEKFDEKIDAFLKENSVIRTNTLNEDIKAMRESTKSILISELQIIDINKLINSSYGMKAFKILSFLNSKTFSIGVFILDSLFIGLLFLIWKKRFYRASAWIGYSAIASGLMMFLVAFSGYISKFYNSLIIGIPYLKEFICSIIKSYLSSLSVISLTFIGIGFAFSIVYIIHSQKVRR